MKKIFLATLILATVLTCNTQANESSDNSTNMITRSHHATKNDLATAVDQVT